MRYRYFFGFTIVVFGVLVGCSKKTETADELPAPGPQSQRDIAKPQPDEKILANPPVAPPQVRDERLAELRRKPITAARDELGELLTKWWSEGVAAGNVGDFYDNRDRAHSDLDTIPYPQLQRIRYDADDVKHYRDWALMFGVRPHVVFGNSSTAAATRSGGSNARLAQCLPGGVALLAKQYKGNNLYIYPECNDARPGHNGRGGDYGDLLPTNTPYMLIPHGNSYSDQPFMRAVPLTLAAFRPEVKQKLIATGTLMAALQMIVRSTSKDLTGPQDYLTGKAHPTAFQGASLDALRMVKLAHEITIETLPPVVQLKVMEEDGAQNGRDFFEPADVTEELATTSEVIARIWRSKSGRRRMVVSAAGSYDLNNKPLTFTWVVLRGDATQVRITPRNKEGTEVEIALPYHPRRPVASGAALESNRVDIGAFVHNGSYYSAPGFVTFYTLDNEGRSYDERGQPLEISYGIGDADVRVSNYGALLQALKPADALPSKVFQLTAGQRAVFDEVIEGHRRAREELEKHRNEERALDERYEKDEIALQKAKEELERAKRTDAEKTTAETKVALATAAKKVDEAATKLRESETATEAAYKVARQLDANVTILLEAKRAELGESVTRFVENKLHTLMQTAELFETHEKALQTTLGAATAGRRNTVELARQRLLQSGLVKNLEGGRLQWHPDRVAGKSEPPRTPFEKQELAGFNSALLSELIFPGALSRSAGPNYVDHQLFTVKSWRDVYHYDGQGKLAGWTRHDSRGATDFTELGLMVLEKDTANRPRKVRKVRYVEKIGTGLGQPNTLETVLGDEIISYRYDNGNRIEINRIPVHEQK